MGRSYYTSILASDSRKLYVGVTNDLYRRVALHRAVLNPQSYTTRHQIFGLMYRESTDDVVAAIRREKQIKGWRRRRKLELINKANPDWLDLAEGMQSMGSAPSLRSG